MKKGNTKNYNYFKRFRFIKSIKLIFVFIVRRLTKYIDSWFNLFYCGANFERNKFQKHQNSVTH